MADVSDVIVVGGGVVGCAIIWELTSRGYECLLLEKNENLVSEASSGNSGMLHTGFDSSANSLEFQCIKHSFPRMFDLLKGFGLPYEKFWATMVAWTQEQVSKLPIIAEKSRAAGISSASEISLSELYRREPGLSRHAQGALWIPEETVVDPWLTAISLVHDARRKGAVVKTDTVVQNTCKADHNQYVHVMTSRGQFTGRVVINCGGLYGDIVDKLAGLQHFSIVPKKGQYAVYPKTVKHLINSSILPIPTDKGKGEIIFKTVYGNVIIGPTFEEAISKRRPESDSNTIQRLIRYGESCVKGLGGCPIVNTYTGVRPATEIKDYYIDSYPESGWITVGGIRSTGLSGSLGIADKVRKLVLCQHNLEPSRAKGIELNKMAIKFLPPGHAMIDDVIYTVTHPITLCGMDTPMESHL
ncbi:glycerol 3-phosphate dehydrogenase-like [Saccostrea echinata]|uniref:glycerol 3-phosphate dehydrogenase-like n=1 Tax=Saccostrea echinata TaxID=191078 RepID=UPI002A80613C|nr:glycerol 3-phosphate dehydrogenase-like [Saccostrea echinata]